MEFSIQYYEYKFRRSSRVTAVLYSSVDPVIAYLLCYCVCAVCSLVLCIIRLRISFRTEHYFLVVTCHRVLLHGLR